MLITSPGTHALPAIQALPSIGIDTLEAAAIGSPGPAPQGSGLTRLTDKAGTPLAIGTADGCTGTAYTDAAGRVVISFQYTTSQAQLNLDDLILRGASPAMLPGFQQALGFARQVLSQAAAAGIPTANTYVTGYSLGGSLAEYVARQTGLAGASFAGSGLAGLHGGAGPNPGFVSFVDKGDPFANFATDGGLSATAALVSPHMDHEGTVVSLGSQSDGDTLMRFVHAVQRTGVDVVSDPMVAMQAAPAEFAAAFANHQFNKYRADIAQDFAGRSLGQIVAAQTMAHVVAGPISPAGLSVLGAMGHATATAHPLVAAHLC